MPSPIINISALEPLYISHEMPSFHRIRAEREGETLKIVTHFSMMYSVTMEVDITNGKHGMLLNDFKRLINDYKSKNLLNFDGYNCLAASYKPKFNRSKDKDIYLHV